MIGSRFVLSALVAGVLFAASAGSGLASFPGVNGKIFFVARAPAGAEANHLFAMGPDGLGLTQLTDGSGDDEAVGVAGGGRVVLSRDTHEECGHLYWAQGVDLFTLNADGTGLTRLTNNCPASDSTPAWSPTGNHLVFSRSGELWSMRPDGSDAAKLTCNRPGNDGGDYEPTWSPDGRLIAFERLGQVYVMDTNGSNQRFVAMGSSPSFSPDGTKLAYAAPVFSAPEGIHVVSLNGTGDVRLTSGYDGDPVWSPDGNKIAFIQSSDQFPRSYAISTMNADGSNIVRIMDKLDARSLDWAQGGAPRPAGIEANVTAAQTACAETISTPTTQAPQPTQDPVSGPAPLNVAASSVRAPNRLTVARLAFTPTILRSRKAFSVALTIRDLGGRAVTGAAVRITPVRGDARPTDQASTGSDGAAILQVRPTGQLRLRPGSRLVLAVHVRRPGDPWTAEISGMRLISIRAEAERK